MKLRIRHQTTYHYDEPVPYGLQQLRLTPQSGASQRVESWKTAIQGGHSQLEYEDHHNNLVTLVGVDRDSSFIAVLSEGVVDTIETAGIIPGRSSFAPLWLFERETPLTAAGDGVRALAEDFEDLSNEEIIPGLHELSNRIGAAVEYEKGSTNSFSTAEGALESGSGVCQDHAHIFISAARHLGIPARYVSGYLLMDDDAEQATHAWGEAWIANFGWIGFDVSNSISPDERYVRIATGLDYRDAAPIAGIRFGGGNERMAVTIEVQAQQSQSQSQSQ